MASLTDWLFEVFVCPFWSGFETKSHDAPKPKVGVKEWRLDKFDGDPPKPGENKQPVEYLTGGDGLPTRRFVRDSVGDNFHEVDCGTN